MKSREHKLDICFDFTRGSCRRGDGCRFSHNLPPGGVIPPRPKTAGVCFDYTKGICNRGDACRFSHDAQAVAAFAKREESGGSPTSSKALPKPLPVPAAKPAASSGRGSLGAPRRTLLKNAPSHAIAPSHAKHAKHVGPPANASANASMRRDERTGSIAKTNAPASPARANPWASVAAGAPALSALSPPSRGAETALSAPSFRFGVAPSEHSPFGNDRGAHRADVVGSSDASLAPNVSRPNFSFGSGTASSAESRAGPSPFGVGSVPSSGAGDVRGGAVGAPETAPRGFGNGGAREPGPPGPPEHLGVGSPPAFAGGGLGGLFGGNSASLFGNAFGTGSPGAGAGAGAAPVWGGGGLGALRGGVGGFGAFDGGASGGSY